MSYDFMLFKPRPGEDPAETAQRDVEEWPSSAPPDPEKEALKRRVANALMAFDSKLKIHQFDYQQIAKTRKISLEQARLQFRHLELDDETTGLHIMLSDDDAGLSVPYWHAGEKADPVFRQIFGCLQIICRETGYVAFDPQIDSVVDLTADPETIVALYTGQVSNLADMVPPPPNKPRPWWKFW
jgi:hypothetical protein